MMKLLSLLFFFLIAAAFSFLFSSKALALSCQSTLRFDATAVISACDNGNTCCGRARAAARSAGYQGNSSCSVYADCEDSGANKFYSCAVFETAKWSCNSYCSGGRYYPVRSCASVGHCYYYSSYPSSSCGSTNNPPPPSGQKYGCLSASPHTCVAVSGGAYTSPTCNNNCSGDNEPNPPATVTTNVGIYIENGDDLGERTDNVEDCIQGKVSIAGMSGSPFTVYGGTGGHCDTASRLIERPSGGRDIKVIVPEGYEVIGGFWQYTCSGCDTTKHSLEDYTNPEVINSARDISIRWGLREVKDSIIGIYLENGKDPDNRNLDGPDSNPAEPCIATGKVNISNPQDGNKNYNVLSSGISCDYLKTIISTGGCHNDPNLCVIRRIKLIPPPDYEFAGGFYQHPGLDDKTGFPPGQDYVDTAQDLQVRFGVRPSTYQISGGIFLDVNEDGKKNASENYIAGAGKIKIKGPITTTSPGTTVTANPDPGTTGFKETGFVKGKYTVTYTNLDPTKYEATYPPGDSASFPAYTEFRIGSNCDEAGFKNLTCGAGGGMTGVDFGVIPVGAAKKPWYQITGGSVSIGRGITNRIPDDTSACAIATEHYMGASQASPAIDPGVILSGGGASLVPSGSTKTSAEKASINKWLVTDVPRPYSPSKTSYTYLTDQITKGGLFPNADIFTAGKPCAGQTKPSCTLPANFASGVYMTNPGFILPTGGAYTFAANRNYIFLINGELIISKNLIVPAGTTVMFVVKGNITVTSGVTRIDGVYSTEKSFLAPPANPAGTDTRLVIQGNVITNAAGLRGDTYTFSPTRDLGIGVGTGNYTCPAVRMLFRPDFVLNLPDTIKIGNKTVQEVNSNSSTSTGNYVTPTPN